MDKTLPLADPAPEDYPYIRRWGRLLRSFEYYITLQVERARREHAPANAVYRDMDGHWVTTDQIENAYARGYLGLPLLRPRERMQ